VKNFRGNLISSIQRLNTAEINCADAIAVHQLFYANLVRNGQHATTALIKHILNRQIMTVATDMGLLTWINFR
jgi:hypothetical protein